MKQDFIVNDVISFLKTKETFGELSNMCAGFPLAVNDIHIKNSEALYQACRFPHNPEIQEEILKQHSPMASKMVTHKYRELFNRKDWLDVRVEIMKWCVRIKAFQHTSFQELLFSLENKIIVEESKKDDFWGAYRIEENLFRGENILGFILMDVRDEFLYTPPSIIHPLNIPSFKIMGEYILDVKTQAPRPEKSQAQLSLF